MSDLSRRKALLLLGTSATALGSGCLSSLGLSSENDSTQTQTRTNDATQTRANGTTRTRTATNTATGTRTGTQTATRTSEATGTRTQTQTSETARTQTRTRSNGAGRLRYKNDLRQLAWTSGKSLSAVSGVGPWTGTGGSVTTTDWDGAGGSTAARIVSPKETPRVTMETTFDKPIDLTTTALSFGIRLKRAGSETLTIRALAPDDQNRITMDRYVQKRDGVVRLDIAPGEITGSPDLKKVRGLRIASYPGDDKPFELHVGAFRLRKVPKRRRGAVILTFDDARPSQFDPAKSVMDEFGYAGTVGVIPWDIGKSEHLTRDQLHTMADDGWEMASHPHPPPPNYMTHLPKLSDSLQRQLLERSKQWLLDEGFPTNGETFIWPFGAFDSHLLDLVSQYHRVSFAGGASPAPWAITEPSWVPRVDGDNPDEVRQAVDMAAKFGTVATVMYHTIGTDELSTSAFRNELQYVKQSNVDVVVPSKLAGAQPY